MRREDRDLNVPDSPGSGTGTRCDTWVDKWVEVDGTFTGSVAVEGRFAPDSANWVQVDTAAGGTQTTLIEVKPLFYEVRLNTTSLSTGSVVAKLAGLDRRTD